MDTLKDKRVKFYAVCDNQNNYFNGSFTYEDALEELNNYRAAEDDGTDFLFDPADVYLVAVLDV